jgi:CsoR family transcriptional regulator, copper-sensing transcriptional repressor
VVGLPRIELGLHEPESRVLPVYYSPKIVNTSEKRGESHLTYTPRGVYTKRMDTHKDNKEKIIRRLKILEGQVRGLQQLVEDKAYCIDIITQTSAVKQGISNFEDLLLEEHLGHCVVNQIKRGDTEKATQEILKVYQLKRK